MVLCGTDLPVSRCGALFATLNPAYVGRVKIPDNLRSLFRSIKMVQPDYKNICSVSLYAGGYGEADRLSGMVEMAFGSMRSLLSSQHHYDFRLRAIRATLRACEDLQRNGENGDETDKTQEALLKINLPKLVSQDTEKFGQLVLDFFPGRLTPSSPKAALLQAVIDACQRLRLTPSSDFVSKTLEVYESTRLREGTILIGETMSGKTTALTVLKEAMNRMAESRGARGEGLVWEKINPKAVSSAQLFGYFDSVSHDWIDGMFGRKFREFSLNTMDEELWLVLDGSVEASWVETLNSVLDDNRKLCLPNGEIISLSSRMRLVFETDSLLLASPATVSRCAVVAFPSNAVTTDSILQVSPQYQRMDKEIKDILQTIVRRITNLLLQKKFVFSITRYLGAFESRNPLEDRKSPSKAQVVLSALWASSDLSVGTEFQLAVRALWEKREDPYSIFPVTERGNETWIHLSDTAKVREMGPFSETKLFFHSEASVRISILLHRLLAHSIPTLIVGPTLSGKTSLLLNYLHQLSTDRYFLIRLSGSRLSSANDFEEALFPQLERSRKDGVYSGPEGKEVILVIENLESIRSGNFCLLEALRQLCEQNLWSSSKDGTHSFLRNVKLIATCNDVGSIPSRLLSKWHRLQFSFAENTFKQLIRKLKIQPEEDKFWTQLGKSLASSKTIAYSFQKVFRLASQWVAQRDEKLTYHTWCLDRLQHLSFEPLKKNELKRCFTEAYTKSGIKKPAPNISDSYSYKSSTDEIGLHSLPDLRKDIKERLGSSKDDKILSSGLVPTDYVIRHAVLLATSLRRTSGHAVLAGGSGMGKRLVTQLSSHLLGAQFEMVQPSLQLAERERRERLRKILFSVGLDCKPTVLLVPESELWHSSQMVVLADIEVLVNGGQIPLRTFSPEEEGEILEKMQGSSKETAISTSYERLVQFSKNVSENLHIVITLRYEDGRLSEWLCAYPGIRNHTDLHVFEGWNRNDFVDLANQYLENISLIPEKERVELIETALGVHEKCYKQSGSTNLPTPTPATFLELLLVFKELALRKHRDVTLNKARYKTGTDRLDGAAMQVEEMKAELAQLQPRLVATSLETGRLMMQIEHETVEVESAREVVASNEATANEAATRAQAIKMECEQDLAEAVPALEAAVQALNTLKQSDISTLKTLKHPPSGIKLVMSAVCILLREKPTKVPGKTQLDPAVFDYWPTAHRILSDMKFLGRLRKIDKDAIPEDVMELIRSRKYVGNPEFDPEKVKQASLAAEGICLWVRALEMYNRVMKVVRPKRLKLKEAEKEVKEQMAYLVAKRNDLHAVSERMQILNDEFGKMRQKKKDLEQQIRNCEIKTDRAQRLLGGLGDEGERWKVLTRELSLVCDRFLADSFLAALSMTYLVRYDAIFQKEILGHVIGQLVKAGMNVSEPPFQLRSFFDSPRDLHRWRAAGLADDELSVHNAFLVFYSRRWPLILDPQGETQKWLEKVEGSRLSFARLTDESFLSSLENAVTLGLHVAVHMDRDSFDPRISDLLDLKIVSDGSSKHVNLGGKSVKYNEDFRLFLVWKGGSRNLSSFILDKVTVVDFILSAKGVEDRLLDVCVGLEAPDLQKQKEELLVQSSNSRDGLSELEEKILKLLSSTKGSVLEDEGAIEVLSSAKELADGLFKKQVLARKAEEEIGVARERFRPLAQSAGAIFFVFLRLNRITHFYHFTLQWFINILREVLLEILGQSTGSPQELESVRLEETSNKLCLRAFKKASRSIFQADSSVLALCLAELNRETKMALPSVMKFRKNSMAERGQAKDSSINSGMRLMKAAEEIVRTELGPDFLDTTPFDLEAAWEDSTPSEPILLLLTPGYDPLRQMMALAKKMGIGQERLRIRTLGAMEDERSLAGAVKRAAGEGWWLVLQNTHLSPPHALFLLEKIITTLQEQKEGIQKDFRLWLTAAPSPDYPTSLLQLTLKVTTEPPKGIKAQLMRAYELRLTSDVEEGPTGPDCFRLVSLYAAVKERSKYGSIGWRGSDYFFSESDLVASLRTVARLKHQASGGSVESSGDVESQKIATLKPLVIEAYGGRISILQDMDILGAMFDFIFSSDFDGISFPKIYGPDAVLEHIRSLPAVENPRFCGLHESASNHLRKILSLKFETTYLRVKGIDAHKASPMSRENQKPVDSKEITKITETLSRSRKSMVGTPGSNLFLDALLEEINDAVSSLKSLQRSEKLVGEKSELEEEEKISERARVFERCHNLIHSLEKRKELGCWVISVPSLRNPEKLLRGLLHAEARRTRTPADKLKMSAEFVREKDVKKRDKGSSVAFRGLTLQNARFDAESWSLLEVGEKISGNETPLVKLSFALSPSGGSTIFDIPVYSIRKGCKLIEDPNPLFWIRAPCSDDQYSSAVCTLRGVFCGFLV